MDLSMYRNLAKSQRYNDTTDVKLKNITDIRWNLMILKNWRVEGFTICDEWTYLEEFIYGPIFKNIRK